MSNQLNEVEKTFISKVLKKHLGNEADIEVLLFGSMAKGSARPTSDIDIAIKGKSPLDKVKWIAIEADFEESLLPRKVDVVDYWRVTPEFQKIISQQGQVLLASKSHPYRICPIGHHWVSTHMRTIPPNEKHPEGLLTEVDGHCRTNPGSGKSKAQGREILTADEINEMFKRFGYKGNQDLRSFKDPRKKKWNEYDKEIGFWTRFWNEVFRPDVPLDPNIVKALIGSESSFELDPKSQNAGGAGMARGFIQITDEALKILSKDTGELKDYLIEISTDDLKQINTSLAAGVRWLFHKKKLADSALGRESTWDEAILNYKGYLKKYVKDPKQEFLGFKRFKETYAELTP